MVIYLNDYRKGKAVRVPVDRYGEKVRFSTQRVMESSLGCWYPGPRELSPWLPHDLAAIDVDAFLDRVYALASEV